MIDVNGVKIAKIFYLILFVINHLLISFIELHVIGYETYWSPQGKFYLCTSITNPSWLSGPVEQWAAHLALVTREHGSSSEGPLPRALHAGWQDLWDRVQRIGTLTGHHTELWLKLWLTPFWTLPASFQTLQCIKRRKKRCEAYFVSEDVCFF